MAGDSLRVWQMVAAGTFPDLLNTTSWPPVLSDGSARGRGNQPSGSAIRYPTPGSVRMTWSIPAPGAEAASLRRSRFT